VDLRDEHVPSGLTELAATLANMIANRRLGASTPCSSTSRRQIRLAV
jgi:hypothetical protein